MDYLQSLDVGGNINVRDILLITSAGVVSASDYVNYNFSGSKALVSNNAKQITESPITSAELFYLSGVSANIQTQINTSIVNAIRITPLKYQITIPSNTWIINHGLDRYPNFSLRISTTGYEGYRVEPRVKYDDENTMTLTFSQTFIGNICLI